MKGRSYPMRSIRQRMTIMLLGFSLVAVCLTAGFSHYYYGKAVKEEFVMIASEATGRLNHHMEFYFRQMKNSTNTLLNTDLVQNWLSEDYTPSQENIAGIEREMKTYVSFNFREITNMYLVSMDNRILSLNSGKLPVNKVSMEEWFPRTDRVELIPTRLMQDSGPLIMEMQIPIHSTATTELAGHLVVQFTLTELDAAFDKSRLGQTGVFFLVSQEGDVVNHPNKAWAGKPRAETPLAELELDSLKGTHVQSWNGLTYLISISESEYTGWNIISMVPYAEMAKGLNSAVFSTMTALAVLAVCIWMAIPFLVNQFVAPIKQIKSMMELVSIGNLGVRAKPISRIHEYEVLTNSFNRMVEQLNELMHTVSEFKVKEMELRLRQSAATVRALQNQINPHLLYNTLDIIKSIAYLEEVPLIEKIVYNLADVYRYATKSSDQEVTVREELGCLVKYLEIVHIRYPKKFQSSVKVSEKFMECPIIKLTIQPIVENAVKYAVEARGGDAAIIVTAYDERQDLIVEIADNGPGITEDVMEELQTQFAAVAGNETPYKDEMIGLVNVHARLFLKYGSCYGVSINSFPGRGSVVSVRIPLVPRYNNTTRNKKIV